MNNIFQQFICKYEPKPIFFFCKRWMSADTSPLHITVTRGVFGHSFSQHVDILVYDGAGMNRRKKSVVFVENDRKKFHRFQKQEKKLIFVCRVPEKTAVFLFCRSRLHHRTSPSYSLIEYLLIPRNMLKRGGLRCRLLVHLFEALS